MDFVGLAVALTVFALFHHVIPVYGGGAKLHIVNVGAESADAPFPRAARRSAPCGQ